MLGFSCADDFNCYKGQHVRHWVVASALHLKKRSCIIF